MREANMIAAHVNYLLHWELVFCCVFISGIILTTLSNIYMTYYVNGSRFAKIIFQVCFGFELCICLFTTSIISIFYIAIKIKFSLLNDYFKWVDLTNSLTNISSKPIQKQWNPIKLNNHLLKSCICRLIFIPSSIIVSQPSVSSVEMQTLISKMAQIHDRLCQIFFRFNRYAAIAVIFNESIQLESTFLCLWFISSWLHTHWMLWYLRYTR